MAVWDTKTQAWTGKTVHVHFIDQDEAPEWSLLHSLLGVTTETEPRQVNRDQKLLSEKLRKDIKSLCLFTDGIHLTHFGRTSGVLHCVLNKLLKDDNFDHFRSQRSVATALAKSDPFQGMPQAASILPRHGDEQEQQQCVLQKLLGSKYADEVSGKRPVVCVLINGGTESLKTATAAIKNGIPLIVMKGAGGYADLVAHVCSLAQIRPKRKRIDGVVRTVTIREVSKRTRTVIREELRAISQEDAEMLDVLLDNVNLLTVYNPSCGTRKTPHADRSSPHNSSNSNQNIQQKGSSAQNIQPAPSSDQDIISLDQWLNDGSGETAAGFDSTSPMQKETSIDEDLKSSADADEPVSEEEKCLDAVILEALLKHRQESKIQFLLHTMQQRSKDPEVGDLQLDRSTSFIEDSQLQLTHFTEALVTHTPTAVTAFLGHLDLKFTDFHFGRVLHLYSLQEVSIKSRTQGTDPVQDLNSSVRNGRQFMKAREKFKTYVPVSPYPLRCHGLCCSVCSLTYKNALKAGAYRTCLHPVQELFLWSLWSHQLDLAVALWEQCDDKMAAALFARAVFKGMAREINDIVLKKEIESFASHFEELAIHTIRACQELDEVKAAKLLTKPCPWWGDLSVLQVAIVTRCKAFVAEEACQRRLDNVWSRDCQISGFCRVVDTALSMDGNATSGSRVRKQRRWTSSAALWTVECPRNKYCFSLVLQVAFLMLFSYVLLFDFDRAPTPCFIALCVCVADTAFEELRQLQTAVHDFSVQHTTPSTWRSLKQYWSLKWNRLDCISIILFGFGMAVLSDVGWLHAAGKILLCIDVFVFYMRFLQMFLIFKELGSLLVMGERMVKNTAGFMAILLTVMLGYGVASEAVLYSSTEFSWDRLFFKPGKAYWPVLGDFSPDDMQDCRKGDECPTQYGRYVAPIMLGIYLVITNVLLLNLLIAKFNNTFTEVLEQVQHHQAWQRCQTVLEFCVRSALPPPFNILRCLWVILRQGVCALCCKWSTACGACCRKDGKGPNDAKLSLATTAHGKCILITGIWTPSITVEIRDQSDVVTAVDKYAVPATEKGRGQLILWRDNPATTVHVSLANKYVLEEEHVFREQRQRQAYYHLQKFESQQAIWARDQLKSATDAGDKENAKKRTELQELYQRMEELSKQQTQHLEHLLEKLFQQHTVKEDERLQKNQEEQTGPSVVMVDDANISKSSGGVAVLPVSADPDGNPHTQQDVSEQTSNLQEDSRKEFEDSWFRALETQSYIMPPFHVKRLQSVSHKVNEETVQVIRPDDHCPLTDAERVEARDDRTQERVLCSLQYLIRKHPAKTDRNVMVALSKVQVEQTVLDVLIFHKKDGILLACVKSVTSADPENLRQSLSEAVDDLDRSRVILHRMCHQTMADGSRKDPSIQTTLILPNVTSTFLQDLLDCGDTDSQHLKQELQRCLKVPHQGGVTQYCLCEDDMLQGDGTRLDRWLAVCLRRNKGGDSAMESENVYIQLVKKFINLTQATTVQLYLNSAPRLQLWDHGQALAMVGEHYGRGLTRLALFPQQVQLLQFVPSDDEEDVTILHGPPGTGKTIMLLLKGIDWLKKSRSTTVFLIQTRYDGLAAACLIKHQLVRTLGQEAEDRVQFRDVCFQEDLDKFIQDMLDHAAVNNNTVHILADEARSDFVSYLYKQLSQHHLFLRLWTAGVTTKLPSGMDDKVETLTEPLRSPPAVVTEVNQANLIKSGKIPGYATSFVPTQGGPAVITLNHYSVSYAGDRQGHEGGYPWRCLKCCHLVAETLNSLCVGRGMLSFRDVFILGSGIQCEAPQDEFFSPALLIQTLQVSGIPTQGVSPKDTAAVQQLAELSGPDKVTVTHERTVWGLERKVVVYLDTSSGYGADFSGRLMAISRATAQVVFVKYVV